MTDAHARPPVSLPHSHVRMMRAQPGDREYRIFVAVPDVPAPESGFPVIYLLDANATFGTVVDAIRMRSHRPGATGVVPAVVVGIAYPIDGPYDRERRTYDFTPRTGDESGGTTGGAEPFLEFLNEVRSAIEGELAIDARRRTLVGHSLGGLFALHTLIERPTAFQTYVAMSPSLWWHWETLLDQADDLAKRLAAAPLDLGVFISVGEFEQALAPWQLSAPNASEIARRREERQMVSRSRAFAERLSRAAANGLRVKYEEFAGEDHASVVPMAISRALRFALAPSQP